MNPMGNKTLLIAKELKFIKCLAGNDPKIRRKVLKNLKSWLSSRSRSSFAFTDTDFARLWKGLFYCMWMADKPLLQESLADEIASLLQCFEDLAIALQCFAQFLETMCTEWVGIDNWRMDKFMMMVRRCTRQVFSVLHSNGWPMKYVLLLVEIIDRTILDPEKCPFGLMKHFNDLLLEEIAKVSEGELEPEVVHKIVSPYIIRLVSTNDRRRIRQLTSSIFHHLLYQSELGQEYQEKFNLWKQTDFVTGDIDGAEFQVENEQASDDEAEADGDVDSDEKVFDPRAGQVDVVINELKFDPVVIVQMFEDNRFKPFVSSKGRKQMKMLVRQYRKFSAGDFPLGVQTVDRLNDKDHAVDIVEQLKELDKFEKNLTGGVNHKMLKKRNKKTLSKGAANKIHKPAQRKDTVQNGIQSPESSGTKLLGKKKKKSAQQLKEAKLQKLRDKRELKLKILKKKKEANATKKTENGNAFGEKKDSKVIQRIEENETFFAPKTSTTVPSIKLNEKVSEKQSLPKCEVESKVTVTEQRKRSMEQLDLVTPVKAAKAIKAELKTMNSGDGTKVKKRVKIALNKNVAQDIQQHIEMVKKSPQLPFDSNKRPKKAALKPNLMPSPINPFYRKKIKLAL